MSDTNLNHSVARALTAAVHTLPPLMAYRAGKEAFARIDPALLQHAREAITAHPERLSFVGPLGVAAGAILGALASPSTPSARPTGDVGQEVICP